MSKPDRRVTLEPPDKFDRHALTNLSVWWASHGNNRTSLPLSRGELQSVVDQAGDRFEIRHATDTRRWGAVLDLAMSWECEPPGQHPTQYLHRESCPGCHRADQIRMALSPCDTCRGTGRVEWMIEGDPNCYQERDSDGMIPCPDCTSTKALS